MNLSETLWAAWDRIVLGWSTTSEQVPKVLHDPRSYPREAMLLAAAAALALILIVLVTFVTMDAVRASAARRRLGVNPMRARRMHFLRTVLLVLALIAPVLAIAPSTTVGSRLCGSCHGVAPYVQQWEAGRHASVGCWGCHSTGGLLGAFEASAREVTRIVRRTAVRPGAISMSRCLGCHGEITRGSLTVERLTISHAEMIDAGMSCLPCHQGTGHAVKDTDTAVTSVRTVVEFRSRMSRCLVCHDGRTASSECRTCHVEGPLDQAVAAGSDPQTHLVPRCRGCHKPSTEKKCIDCHGLELPHPGDFMSKHAGMSFATPVLCAKCHELASSQEACGCHNDTNIHGTYSIWFPAHGPAAIATNNGAGCNCHEPLFCAYCHDTPVLMGRGL